MSLSAATLLSGLLLAVSGGLLLWNNPAFAAALRAFPRSKTAALVLFGAGAAWFLWLFWHAAEADRFSFHNLLFVILAATAVLSFRLVPDFLAVRGAAVLVLLAAAHLLD
ncbi:MAG: hypothetical protein LBR12_00420, partial [Opitutaceae bacterium]|nr:hypothetical protein [Opitutaceae bacterium]